MLKLMKGGAFGLLLFSFFTSGLTSAYAGELKLVVSGPKYKPVEGTVVTLTPLDSTPIPPVAKDQKPAVMDQVDKQFSPYILVIQKGTSVTFPNSDSIKHHVYSFSKTKPFQLKLYKNRVPDPLLFDKAGAVALGCNIHDWMVGYIYVTDTPWYGRTNKQGESRLEVPDGHYRLKVWHPLLKQADIKREQLIHISGSTTLNWTLAETLHEQLNQEHSVEAFDDY